jgi:hypothetical protein
MKSKTFAIILGAFAASQFTMHAAVIATDNFENDNPGTAYNDGIQYNDNGGTGFGALTYIEGNGGGLFNASLSGSRALGIFSGSNGGNTQALGRTLTTTTKGTYTLQVRFDVNNSVGFSGINIKSAIGSLFGTNELLSVGITPTTGNTSIFVGGATNTTISLGYEVRGVNFDLSLEFNTDTGAYIVGVKKTTDSVFSTVSGTMKDTNGGASGVGALAAVGFGNFNTGNDQNLVVDNLSIVPEPSAALLGGLGVLALLRRRRL